MKHFHHFRATDNRFRKINVIFAMSLLLVLGLCFAASQAKAGPAPIQTFFVPLPELQVQAALEAVDTGQPDIGDVMRSMISIAATGDNTIIYYDHWEDGYEADLANPVQASTEIWGDDDTGNGSPPGFGADIINSGDVITLASSVPLPRNPAQIHYDGRDKFGGTRAVAVTRASWALDPGVVLAGAVEVYPLRDYGLQFEVPVGEDLGSDQMFEYVSLFVLASEDGTDIQIDIDGDGTTDITQTLNLGESYQVDGGIDTGASVTASRPVQTHIFTGDVGARFESRFYTLYPVENWSDSYYSPVGTATDGDETYVFVYNPNAGPITVDHDTRIGGGSFAVAAGSAYRYLMPSNSGAHFYTDDGSLFFAIATVGADPGANLVHDWGFSLLPESYLTPMAVVGWGPGSDDLSQNGSPVWVTAASATTVYVDYDGDPATGPLTDANGDHYDVALNLATLESARVYDNSDNDQTGMKLYTLDGTLITAAWGQDPATSGGGSPYLDLGTTVLPFPIASVEKASALVVDENSNGLVDWGDTIEYTITVNNDGVVVLGGVVALDPLPAGVTYVSGSTTLNGAPVADESVPPAATEYPLDEGGLAMPVIPPTEFSTITFRVTVDAPTTSITNTVSINTDQEVLTTDDTIDVNTPDVTACSLEFTDGGGVSQATYLENSDIYVTVDDYDQNTDAGSAQSFTVVVVNTDSGDTETITLTETGNDTGVFRNGSALASSATGGMSDEDGTLYAVAGNTVQVAYTDPVFGDTCSDTAGITVPTEIKPLYLSEPGQSMDRVDPVATGDSTTATSAMLSFISSETTGMAVWSAAAIPEYNPWDGSAFGTTQDAVTQGVRWRVMAGAAAPTREEKIVVGIEDGGEISGELWNGSSWSKTSLTSLAYVNETFWWSADVAYEQQSGDAMLVWSGGNTYPNQLRFQVWNGSSWTAPASIAAYTGSEPKQMQLAANPNSDEMVLVVNDANEYDYALVWDGSSWGNQRLLATSTTDDRTDIFVAYEQQSGRAMVVYGKGISGVYYRLWNGSGWSGENSVAAPAGVDGYARWTTLGSDPNSNRIVMGVVSSGSDPWLSLWNGSSWDASVLASALNSAPTTLAPNIAVAFESTSGQAMAVCGATDSKMVYRTWDSGSGLSTATTHPFVADGNTNSMMLYSDPISDQLMFVVQDGGQDVNYIPWDGSGWGSPTELETASGEIKNQPFVFLYDQHIIPVGSSTTFTQSPAMCKDFVIPAGGQVTVTNYVNVSPSTGSVTRSIAASSDDAEEEGPDGSSPGAMYLNSSDIELVEDFEPSTSGTQKIGLRFTNISVPADATITNAYITFRAVAPDAPNTNSGATSLTIEGHAADNPGTFPTTAYDITNRPRTTASIGWSPAAWTTGNDYNTPDLSTIVQELVDRGGWASGNSMVFIVTGTGSRSSESWDDPGSNPAQLTIEYTTGNMPANPDISATIKHDGTTIETLANPSVTDLGSNIYRLDWTDVITSDTTVSAGEQVELEITAAEPGVIFEILYDSSTYPSKILLPTTTVIVIHVDTLGAYDAPYPGGSPVTDAQNGATLYLRATVSDPFGTDDITDLDLSISDPCGGGPINMTLDDGDVVATAGCSKTYEYAWNTGMCEGNYDIVAVANEGTEGITDSAAIRVTLSFVDTGTAGITSFTDGAGNPQDNYDADATVCVQVIDMDQNTDPAVAETLSAVVTSSQGDSETMTLTETGVDTGIFRACVASSSTEVGAINDGSLYALPGDVLAATYTDPDDASDTSDDTALVNIPSPDMTLAKYLIDPADGSALVNDLVRFDIVVGSPGPTDLTSFTVTDTFDSACMRFDAASITPDSIGANTLTWDESELGTLPVGSSVTVSVWFTADAACAPANNSVSATGFDQNSVAVSAGPADAQVTITAPALNVTKTLISPNAGPAYVGDPVTFRITLENTGTTDITTLPLADTFSAACFDFQSVVPPAPAPDGIGAGALLWNDLGILATGASRSLDVILTVIGECSPALNTADVSFAKDEYGDSLPPTQDTAGLQTIGAEIGDRVWNDRDGDGVQDAGEGGIAGVIVFVDVNDDGTRDAGEPYDTTDVTGAYDITDLAAGSYTVWVDVATLPAGAVLTGGSNPLPVVLAAGQDFNAADFGYRGNASIGDFIWDDTDGDGSPDGGEPGLADVTVFLDMDGDGALDAGESFVVTDAGGNYDFTNLPAGDYVVDVEDTTLPPNYVLTTGAASLSVTLADGEDYNDADFGYRQQGGVNGHLFDDLDGDGVQDPGEADLAGIDVVITDSNGDQQTVTTDANGDYQAFLPPGATTLDVDDTTLPPNAFITTANDPQTVTVVAGAFADSSDVGYQFGIPSRMKLRTGSYTGNGIAGTPITGLGFEPDVVIIKVADDTKEGVMRTSSMIADNSKPMGGATALETGLIQSLDADGFTVGADDRVNKDTFTYHWIAFEAGDGEMTVDSYTGTGADNTSVTGVGFQPDYVMVLPAINKEPVHRSSAQLGDSTLWFKNSASVTNHVQALEADGFQVGDDDRVNKLNETYHYIAWREVVGKMAVDSYAGNATDGTEIDGLGFAPEYVIVKQDNTKEAVHRPDSLDGDNTLWFNNQSQSADMIQELQSDGFQIGLDDNVNASGETYFWAAFAGSHLTISSAADQAFYVNDPATVIQTITITEDNLDPTITAANDIRIRIPAGFNMTWDSSVTTASIGGMAAAKVTTAVTYEDGDRTLVLDVTSDFTASDQITVSLLRFNNFAAGSPADNLELEVDNGDTVAAVDDKTITIAAPTISSAADQYFIVGSLTRAIQTITITENSYAPSITDANDIRIRIPAGFNMTWDTTVATATIGGSAAGKVSTTVSYEDGGKTLVLDVSDDFAASDQITISDLSFTDFSAASLPDNLELEVKDDGLTTATDDKTIAIGEISFTSADNQEFLVGDGPTAISPITITEDSTTAIITAANDIRIRIPDDFYMLWDVSDNIADITGSAAAKVSSTVSFTPDGKTLVLDVSDDFAPSDQITISGLSFTNFTAPSFGDRLELEVFNDGQTTAEDEKWKAIGGLPTAGSMLVYGESNQIEPRYRTWDGSSFSIESLAEDTNSTISWVVLKPSPVTNEMIMGVYSTDNTLYIQTWDGSSWTSSWSTVMNLSANYRGFDIAYEQNSGDVIVVFSDDATDTLEYRKRVDGVWDPSDQNTGITLGDAANWVRAESRPDSDDIFVGAQTNSKTLFALRWDGTANNWVDQIQTTAVVRDANREAFDIAFESASGDAFLVWGDDAENVKYRQFTTSWDGSDITAYSGLSDDVLWLAAAYDPQATSSNIALAMVLNNNTFEFGAWDGSTWGGRPDAIDAPNKDNRFIDVAFESDTGEAVYGFTQDVAGDDKKKFAWRTWTSAGGFSGVTVEDNISDEIKFVQLKADPTSDDIMAVYADKSKDLYYRFWNGSSWTALPAPLEIELSDENQNEAFMFAWKESPATAIDLLEFIAIGQDAAVQVSWQTAREFDNVGFHLYRSASVAGPFTRITDELISAVAAAGMGGSYSYVDTDVTVGSLYYYKLEDIDIYGKHTFHGPICVDWDADGMPDDWEIAHGLSTWVNDADLDYDGDGLSNLEEYERGLDPFNPDTDGDGIPDGEEDGRLPRQEDNGSTSISRGVEVLAADDTGMTLMLSTSGFETQVVTVDGQEYEKLSIADYVHGTTAQVGAPQLPIKGILIDVPAGKKVQLEVLNTSAEPFSGYRIYPVPAAAVDDQGGAAAVGELFVQDEIAYSTDGLYPDRIAQLGQSHILRDQLKQQVIFYPIRFDPAAGQLVLYRKIKLRIDFVEAAYAKVDSAGHLPWQPPGVATGVLSPIALGFAAAPLMVSPISPVLSSLGSAAAALWSPPDNAGSDVYKIITSTEGIYRLTKDYLDTNGVDTAAINLSQVRIYHLGDEIAVDVFDQNSNDHLDAADYIRFYAPALDPVYTKYSAENVFWLSLAGGSGAPRRMQSIAAAPSGGEVADDFIDSVHHEQNRIYWLKVAGADSIERWYFNIAVLGDRHAGGGQPVPYTIAVPRPTSSGTLSFSVVGLTDAHHQLQVAINGEQHVFSWSGLGLYEASMDNVALVDGDNTLTLQCLSADGNDVILVDWFKIIYRRDYVAADNRLKFSPDSISPFLIEDFTGNSLQAYDISDPTNVARLDGVVIGGADPSYSIEFEPGRVGETYLVVAADAILTPETIVAEQPSQLFDSANGSDYILITHRDIGWDGNGDPHSWLSDLVAHRQDQGYRVYVADIQDIYDEFSYGIKSPQALKDFLAYAYGSWTPPAPQFVLLVGDSSFDPKDNFNETDTTAYLPTYLIYTDYKGETVTDQWFVTISGDDAIADMHIGRLPVVDADQAAAMAEKIIAYETAVNPQTWTSDLLLVADNRRPGDLYAYEAVFETMNDAVADLLPAAMADPFKAYLNDYSTTVFLTEDIIDALNDGMLMVNFSGHGATGVWADEHIFDTDDVPALTNTDRLAFFVSMSCETGFFAYPEASPWSPLSLAEALLRSDAGAVAALMPTGMTTTEGQQILDTALVEAIFTKDIRTLGPAIAEAKQTLLANGNAYFEQISDTFLLFGDPATELKVPLPHIPTWVDAKRQNDETQLRWNASVDCNGNAVAGYNIYRAQSTTGPYGKINTRLITDTVFVDTGTAEVIAASGSDSYYTVSAVDENGFESVPSLSISPAVVPPPPGDGDGDDDGDGDGDDDGDGDGEGGGSSGGGSSGGGGGGARCFITTAQDTSPPKSSWVLFTIAAVLYIVRTAHGSRRS